MTPIEHLKTRKSTGMSVTSEITLDLIRIIPNQSIMTIITWAINIGVATQNTIHKSIMWLNENDFITIEKNEEDGREKHCTLTKKGKYYLDRL